MKKNNNIKQLKEIVNNELFFDLNYQGVQAYNISSANEYEVIVGFRKCNGRYYFIDRNRNKYLASRYDRADFIAGEMLEQKERENKIVAEAVDSIEKTGEAKIIIDLSWEYIKTCKARGINPGELVDRGSLRAFPPGWHPGKDEERRAQSVRKGSINNGACICSDRNIYNFVWLDLLHP